MTLDARQRSAIRIYVVRIGKGRIWQATKRKARLLPDFSIPAKGCKSFVIITEMKYNELDKFMRNAIFRLLL